MPPAASACASTPPAWPPTRRSRFPSPLHEVPGMMAPALPADSAAPLQRVLFHFDGQLGAARKLRKPRALLYATSLAAVLLFVWAGSARVDRVVRAQGRVIPSGKPQLVQHLEGGIVS